MKKILAIIFTLVLCLGITACAETSTAEASTAEASTAEIVPTETELSVQKPTYLPTEETKPITYTYEVESMQNAECVYYGPGAYVPNSPDPSKVQGKIMVWTQCPNCGEENIGSHAIDPAELDFSFDDTIMHSDKDSCWDCSWEKDIDQFMWTIRITRVPQ